LLKAFIILILLISSFNNSSGQQRADRRLSISPDGHSFQYGNGHTFFWLGDTGWQMLFRLSKEEIARYLEDRRQKGFTVIQTVALDDSTDPIGPNYYGDLPLVDQDLDKPNQKYFELIDWTIKLAQKKGLYIALMTTWAGNVVKKWGTPDAIFDEAKAYRYGLYLGKRYRDCPNLIWITGGDRPAFSGSADWRPLWKNLIRGLREGSGEKVLITYHPAGEASSTDYWRQDSLLDFNMIQSGHRKHDLQAWLWIKRDYFMQPAKPVIDGEPNYEDHPVNWKRENGYFDDYDVRKQLYRTVFSGAAGVTYGNHAIWQFYSPKEKPFAYPDRYWQDALNQPGAMEVVHLKNLMLSWDSATRIPDQDILKSKQGADSAYITAFRDKEDRFAMLYLPIGQKIEINISFRGTSNILAQWFNPRTGDYQPGQRLIYRGAALAIAPPTVGFGNDWVLIVKPAK